MTEEGELPDVVTAAHVGGKSSIQLQFIDIADSPETHQELLSRFYTEMMIPNFPIADELDPLEKWEYLLSSNAKRQTYAPDFHILVVIQRTDETGAATPPLIMGGAVFEYYAQANSGLLTYLTVGSKYRGFGLGKILTDRSKEILERNAKRRGHLAGCNAIFLETNSAMKVQESEDVINPAKRHEIFYKMGLRQVDIDYVQAPLWKGKKKVNYLLLCAFLTPRIPREEVGGLVSYYLPSSLLRNSIRAFWASSSHYNNYRYTDDVDYKRMMDQLRRRNNINLLDLPWERPFTIVDLRESFDLELLVQFYEDVLSPHYASRKEELDPLENWIGQFPPYDQQNNQDDVLFHVALALKYSEDEEENSKPMIVGGLAFEYYTKNNCGFLAYLIVPVGDRGERMARALIDYAVETITYEAKSRGHLSGCNVIFMETSSDVPVQKIQTQELADFTHQHSVLERMGWKLLDFDYIQPPLSNERKKSKNLFLMVYATLRFPRMMKEEVQYEFLPRVTLKTFIEGFWAYACARIGYEYSNDTDYRHMMDDIQRREKIPLLGRPWERPWTLVDLRDDYDHRLLLLFYKELLQPHIAQDELESVEDWLKMLSPEGASKKDFHVLVALKYTGDTPTVLAGLTFKYLVSTNCGFLTYLIMKWQDSKEAVARALVLRAVDILDQDAIARGHLGGCNVIFLETGNLKKKAGPAGAAGELKCIEPAEVDTKSIPPNSVLDITQYDTLLEKMGWRLLDLDYVAPPSFSRRKKLMSLSVFLTPRIPKISHEPFSYYHYLPRPIAKNFMEELWRQTCYQTGYDFTNDLDYRRMMDIISRREKIPLLELPWERPWTLLDLREDYDVRLLYSFYQNFMVPSFPSKDDRVPLSQWIQFLSSDDNPFFEDFHVLLALDYPVSSPNLSNKISEPIILGGCSFSYFAGSNCGFISYVVVNTKQPNMNSKLVMRSFIEEAVEVLDQNAIERGHIAGCNAIFMQASTKLSHPNSLDQTVDHETLQQIGWHLLPFEYHQAPTSASSPTGRPLFLLALQTPKIPSTELCHYIPKELLKNFLQILWGNVFTSIGKRLDKDQDYRRMLTEIDAKDQIQLLKLPWVSHHAKL